MTVRDTSVAGNARRYSGVAITLHWAIAVLMIYMLFWGEDLIKTRRGEALGGFGPSLHVSIGIAILVLTLARITWRIGHKPPPLPAGTKRWEAALSHGVHGLFYVLMIGLPVTGWLALSSYARERLDGESVKVFGLFPADIMPDGGHLSAEIHEIGGKLGILLVILHVVGALKHQFWNRDGLMRRMKWGR